MISFFFTPHQLILIIFITRFFISNSVFPPGYSSPGNPDGTYEWTSVPILGRFTHWLATVGMDHFHTVQKNNNNGRLFFCFRPIAFYCFNTWNFYAWLNRFYLIPIKQSNPCFCGRLCKMVCSRSQGKLERRMNMASEQVRYSIYFCGIYAFCSSNIHKVQ